eukprot:339335-Chlamydomonas_euryale.AAC.2
MGVRLSTNTDPISIKSRVTGSGPTKGMPVLSAARRYRRRKQFAWSACRCSALGKPPAVRRASRDLWRGPRYVVALGGRLRCTLVGRVPSRGRAARVREVHRNVAKLFQLQAPLASLALASWQPRRGKAGSAWSIAIARGPPRPPRSALFKPHHVQETHLVPAHPCGAS